MYAPNAPPPNSGYAPVPGAQPPPYADVQYIQPVVGQPQPMPAYGGGAPYPQPMYPPLNEQGPPPGMGMDPGFVQQQPPYGGPPQPGPPPGFVPPVMSQPGGGEWMPLQQQDQPDPNCPPGLEYLNTIDQLLVHQKVELLEVITGFETANKYSVKNSMGQKVYAAGEISDCCSRNCCGPARPFDMKIVDNLGQEVIHLNRPLACSSCCFPCCLQNMEVTAPPGNVVGSIQQEWSICKPIFSVKDGSGETVLKIKGPICTFSMCGDVEFNVYTRDGETKIGKISKQWSGFVREAFTDADMFGINFPMDLDVKLKAVLLGACFLIDFMFFEKSANQENDRPGLL